MSRSILANWRVKLHISPFFVKTTWIQLFYSYNPFAIFEHLFYNGKKKNHNNGQTRHLGNYDWIHFNLKHTIWNMRNDKKTIAISKRFHPIKPLQQTVAINQNTRIKMEKTNWQNKWMGSMAMGECKDWQRKSYVALKNVNILKEDMEDYQLGNVYTCHGFLPRRIKFEKADSKTFIYKFIERFVNGGFGSPWEPLFNKIYGT